VDLTFRSANEANLFLASAGVAVIGEANITRVRGSSLGAHANVLEVVEFQSRAWHSKLSDYHLLNTLMQDVSSRAHRTFLNDNALHSFGQWNFPPTDTSAFARASPTRLSRHVLCSGLDQLIATR
jgi:hypothetical protein